MTVILSAAEARVLGALMEKEATTPEYYPLSLNALVNACNQKNNREPVMQVGEDEVRTALNHLRDQGLAGAVHDSRVTKYEHHVQEVFNLSRGESAVLCVLLLRGAQTPGELRGRTERMHRFEELDDVLSVLDKLARFEPSLAKALPRQPGSREIRYAHLLSGEPEATQMQPAPGHRSVEFAAEGSDRERIERLEAEVASLREVVEALKAQLAVTQER